METKFFKKLLILTLLIYPLAAQAGEKRASGNISGDPEQQETNKKAKKEYVCNECRKNFTNAFYLKLHKADHESERTGVYEYNCDVCGNYKTNRSSYYKLHKANHESGRTGIWKFNCTPCNFKTNNSGDFRKHEKTLKHKKNIAQAGTTTTTTNSNVPTVQELIDFVNSRKPQVSEVATESQEGFSKEFLELIGFYDSDSDEEIFPTKRSRSVPIGFVSIDYWSAAQELIDFINSKEPQEIDIEKIMKSGGDLNNQPF